MTLDRLDGNSEGFVRPWYQVSAIRYGVLLLTPCVRPEQLLPEVSHYTHVPTAYTGHPKHPGGRLSTAARPQWSSECGGRGQSGQGVEQSSNMRTARLSLLRFIERSFSSRRSLARAGDRLRGRAVVRIRVHAAANFDHAVSRVNENVGARWHLTVGLLG